MMYGEEGQPVGAAEKPFRNSKESNRDDFEYAGVMPVDETRRETLDARAEKYGSLELDYGEGVVRMYGDRDEVENFVEELSRNPVRQREKDHPVESFVPGAEMEAISYLEPDDRDGRETLDLEPGREKHVRHDGVMPSGRRDREYSFFESLFPEDVEETNSYLFDDGKEKLLADGGQRKMEDVEHRPPEWTDMDNPEL